MQCCYEEAPWRDASNNEKCKAKATKEISIKTSLGSDLVYLCDNHFSEVPKIECLTSIIQENNNA